MEVNMTWDEFNEEWTVTIDGETYIVRCGYSRTAMALAACAHAGLDVENCFTCCSYDHHSHIIEYED